MTVMNDLVNEMFYTFARFEYALKATGFIKNTDDAKPDWTKFANSISPLFDNHDDPDVKSAVEFIFADPPNKQVVRDGRLEWRNADSGTVNCCDSLLIFVRRIRIPARASAAASVREEATACDAAAGVAVTLGVALAPSSISISTAPTGTIAPCANPSLCTTPATGEGISMFALSVISSTRV